MKGLQLQLTYFMTSAKLIASSIPGKAPNNSWAMDLPILTMSVTNNEKKKALSRVSNFDFLPLNSKEGYLYALFIYFSIKICCWYLLELFCQNNSTIYLVPRAGHRRKFQKFPVLEIHISNAEIYFFSTFHIGRKIFPKLNSVLILNFSHISTAGIQHSSK